MAKKSLPSTDALRQLLRYEPETGKLYWRSRDNPQWSARYAGREAFTANCNGYKRGKINNQFFFAHRVVWAMMFGDCTNQIDHINGDRADNRIENLRSVTNAENAKNKRHIQNASGVTGVRVERRTGRWRAEIKVSGRLIFLGTFVKKSEAVTARKNAECKYGFHPNHGRIG